MNEMNARIWAEMLYRLAMTFDLVQINWENLPYGQREDWTHVMSKVATQILEQDRKREERAA